MELCNKCFHRKFVVIILKMFKSGQFQNIIFKCNVKACMRSYQATDNINVFLFVNQKVSDLKEQLYFGTFVQLVPVCQLFVSLRCSCPCRGMMAIWKVNILTE